MIIEADLGDLSQFDDSFANVLDNGSLKSQEYLVEGTQEEAGSLFTTGAVLTPTGGVIVAQSADTTLEEYQTNSKGAGGVTTSALGPRAQV
jgi:hypothetical protein